MRSHWYDTSTFLLHLSSSSSQNFLKGSHSLECCKSELWWWTLLLKILNFSFQGDSSPGIIYFLFLVQIFIFSSLENRRLRSDLITLYRFLRRLRRGVSSLRGHGEGAAKHFSLMSSDRIHGSESRLHPGRSLTLGSLFILMTVWSNTGTGVLERYRFDAPNRSEFSSHLDNVLNNTHYYLVSPEVVRQLDWMMVDGWLVDGFLF